MLGSRLKKLRVTKKLTQKQLAEHIKVTHVSISGYENGNRYPDTDTLQRLADYFDVTTDYLLGRSDEPRMSEPEEFDAFANNKELERWYKDLPNSKEEDLEALKQMWEIIKKNRHK